MADKSGDLNHIAITNRHVVLADWLFTTPTVIIQPLTGLWMLYLSQLPLTTPWVMMSLILFAIAGACWLPVVWMQIQMRNMANTAVENQKELPELYWKYTRRWFWLGVPAFIAMVLVVLLMVLKPYF
jgi:uncharacterized membrane protein